MSLLLYQIELLDQDHLPGAEVILAQTFPDSPIVRWGSRLRQEFLRSFVDRPDAHGIVCLQGDRVVGFLVGCEDAARHRRALLRGSWPAILRGAPRRCLESPGLIARLVHGYARRWLTPPANGTPDQVETLPPASLIMMGVAPDHRGQGLADRLIDSFCTWLADRGVARVKLAVEATNVPAVRLYLTRGWRIVSRYRVAGGPWMYRLVLDVRPPADLAPVPVDSWVPPPVTPPAPEPLDLSS